MIPFTGDLDLTNRVFSVRGWHVAETAGAAANVALRHGSATGTKLVDIRLPAVVGGNSVHVSLDQVVLFPKGLFVDVVSGTVTGSIQPG